MRIPSRFEEMDEGEATISRMDAVQEMLIADDMI
jgi:hypothetical protein